MNTATPEKPTSSLRPFLLLWTGQAISLFGSQIVQFALIWWLTQESGSATVLALATLAGMLPGILLGPFAGVLVDRWSRRWTMFTADLVIMLATLLLAGLFWSGVVEIWHVYLILFVRSLGGAFHFPAMQASTTLMVPDEKLTRIQGLNQMLQGGLNIVSAPLGALLVNVLTMPQVLAIDVVTAVAALLPLLFILVPQPEVSAEIGAHASSFFGEMRDGIRYVRSWPGLMILIGMAMLLNLLLAPTGSFIPLLVFDYFKGSAGHLGVIEAFFGVGVIGGGLILGVWGGFQRRIYTTLVGLLLLGVSTLLVGLTPAAMFWLAVVAMFVLGLASSLANGPIMAIFQSAVEPEMQGRVFTLIGSLTMLMAPIGLMIAGPLADVVGIQSWYLIAGAITILVAVVAPFSKVLMGIEFGRGANAAPLVAVVQGEEPLWAEKT